MKNKSVWDTYFSPSHLNTFVTQSQKARLNKVPPVPGPIFILFSFQLNSLRDGGHQVFKTDAAPWLPRDTHSERGMGCKDANAHHAKTIGMILAQNVNYLFNLFSEVDTAEGLEVLSEMVDHQHNGSFSFNYNETAQKSNVKN